MTAGRKGASIFSNISDIKTMYPCKYKCEVLADADKQLPSMYQIFPKNMIIGGLLFLYQALLDLLMIVADFQIHNWPALKN